MLSEVSTGETGKGVGTRRCSSADSNHSKLDGDNNN